jgi:hypothetical protein
VAIVKHKKDKQHTTLEIQAMAWDRQINVVVLSCKTAKFM